MCRCRDTQAGDRSEEAETGRVRTMLKIRASYETESELKKLIELLGCTLHSMKLQPAAGKYKRAYISLIDLKDVEISRDDD